MRDSQSKQLQDLLEAVSFYRSLIIDAVEDAAGTLPQWPHLRSRLLKLFGDRGLPCRVREIFEREEGRTQ